MLLWVFPYDRKLKHLQKLLDNPSITSLLLPKLEKLGIFANPQELSVTSEVLHYLPERSCMVRYQIDFPTSNSGKRQPIFIYAKHYADTTGVRIYDVMQQLQGQFAFGARALAYDPDIQTLWQSHLPGKPLEWRDLTATTGLQIAGLIGQCAANFHACSVVTDQSYSQSQVERDLTETWQIAEQAHPELAIRIHNLISKLLENKPNYLGAHMVPIHHDFKLNNLLLDGSALGLIDMDCVCLGEPEIDLASLIANIYLHGLREESSLSSCHRIVNALTEAYCKNSQHEIRIQRLRWHIAAAFLHEITRRSLRQLDVQRLKHIQAYLDLSEFFAAPQKATGRSGHVVN